MGRGQCVKLEGGRAILPQVEAILEKGIPICGHLGMLPQQILVEGGYRIKGKVEAEQAALMEDQPPARRCGVDGFRQKASLPTGLLGSEQPRSDAAGNARGGQDARRPAHHQP